jgi:hypothetical protein
VGPGRHHLDAGNVTGDRPGHGSEYDVEVNGIGGTLMLRYRITDYQEPTEFVADPVLGLAFDRIGRKAEAGLAEALQGTPVKAT